MLAHDDAPSAVLEPRRSPRRCLRRVDAARCWRSTAARRCQPTGAASGSPSSPAASLTAGRRRPPAAGPRTGRGQPRHPRLRRQSGPGAARRAARWTRPLRPAAPGAVPVLADRARPRPPRLAIADELRALRPDVRSTGWPSTRSPTPASGAASGPPGVGVPGQRVGAHRVGVPASTTCTRSRRSGGWTRSWSHNFMVFDDVVEPSRTTTSWSATRPGTSTTSCTRTRS